MKNKSTLTLREIEFSNPGLYFFVAIFTGLLLSTTHIIHQSFPGAGQKFLPIYLFTLTAFIHLGKRAGFLLALLLPVSSFLVSGMPAKAMVPLITLKAVTLSLLLFFVSRFIRNAYLAISASVGAFIACGIAFGILWGLPSQGFLRDISHGYPGLIAMLLFGWLSLFFNKKQSTQS